MEKSVELKISKVTGERLGRQSRARILQNVTQGEKEDTERRVEVESPEVLAFKVCSFSTPE